MKSERLIILLLLVFLFLMSVYAYHLDKQSKAINDKNRLLAYCCEELSVIESSLKRAYLYYDLETDRVYFFNDSLDIRGVVK